MKNIKYVGESVEPAFSTPIFYTHVDGFEYDVQEMEAKLQSHFYENELQPNTLNSNIPNILLHDDYKHIRHVIEPAMEKYAYEILKLPRENKLRLVDSWMAVGTPGSITNEHMHINSLFSGAFYLFSQPNAGVFTLSMPESHPTYCTPTVKPEPSEWNIFNNHYWSFEPQTNDLIIFPSHVYHRVSPNNSGTIRVVLAFNYFLDGVISTNSTGRLTLKCTEE